MGGGEEKEGKIERRNQNLKSIENCFLERKEKGKKRVEEISQDEKEKIREEERRKIMKEMKREKHASYSSHDSCKSLSEEL